MILHQYIDRETRAVRDETLLSDWPIDFLYSAVRENVPSLFRALTSARASQILGFVSFDIPVTTVLKRFLRHNGLDLSECLDPPESFKTARKVFERRIRYWECRPMPSDVSAVVSPADSRVLFGSLAVTSALFLKEKFFDFEELLGRDKHEWISVFTGGDFAIFRLTPEKYHYNHTPVSGYVKDFYEIPGGYHSCNPGAAVAAVTPCSKNRRVVTIIDTDVPGGTRVGPVAMIEVVALMVGDVEQAYSPVAYEDPRRIERGMFLEKGQPKSLFRPGSSTVVLVFRKGRIKFSQDLLENMRRQGVSSRFTQGFGQPLAETDLEVRSLIGKAIPSER